MKKSILFVIIILTTSNVSSQDYCLYNTQKGFNFGSNYNDKPYKMIQQTDGRFLIMGTSQISIENSFHITGMRLFANGNLDPSFGFQGKIDKVFDQRNSAICADLQADGKILVAGYQAPSNGVSGMRPYVARFNSDGSVDADFGNSGTTLVPFEGSYPGEVAALRAFDDGSIQVISNHISFGFTTSKILPNGDPDSTYNDVGYTTTDIINFGLIFDSPSSLILEDGTSFWVGHVFSGSTYYVSVAKINPDGTVANEFGENGIKVFEETECIYNVAIRSALAYDGNILVSSVNSDEMPFVIKVNSNNGELVTDFAVDGFLVAPIATISMQNNQFVKDEEHQEWVLLFGSGSIDVGTMRIDDDGNILADCSSLFNIPVLNSIGSQSYTCGLFDQEGVLRISGWSGTIEEDSQYESQSFNVMWPYYEPPAPNPIITSITPHEILIGQPVEVSIGGYGFSDTEEIRLISNLDTLGQTTFAIINDSEIQVVFYPETTSVGVMDLVVYLENDTLVLPESVEIIDDEIIGGDVNVYSKTKILVGGQTLFSASYSNKGNKAMLAAPLVIINENPYSMDFTNQPVYNFQEDVEMTDLIAYLTDQGIDLGILNNSMFEDEGSQHHAFLTTNLSPQEAKYIGAITTIDEVAFSDQNIYLHPNPIVGSGGLLETYLPEPGYCMQEIVASALMTSVPSVDFTNYESCFVISYEQLQIDLAAIVRSLNDERLIPFKGAMIKLMYDLMTCIDDTYLISESEFELFNAEMALLFATDVVLNEEFPCDSYAEASTYYHGEVELPDGDLPNNAFDKADPWGLGISFNFCYGCKTYNDIEGASSVDPNEKIGPSQEFGGTFINNGNMYYAIHFENLDSATIAAKTVLIIDSLDLSVFDVSTFKFTNVSWGENIVSLNENAGATEIDLRPEVPNILRISTELDYNTGIATWLFETLDTLSMMPTEDVDQGFLPPNVNAPEGMGFVGFEVNLLEDIQSGSSIENTAQIFFDFNDPIATNKWVNIFDNETPESHVNEITDYVVGDNVVNVTWETEETDPNILFYNIYYNNNGSNDWIPWMAQTTDLEAEFTGELGMTYYFMSVAVDSAFNVEEYADVYDAFVFMEPVGVDEIDQNHSFKLFPNPARDRVIVSVDDKYFDSINLTDMTGRIVLSENVERGAKQYVLALDNVSSGVYNVTLRDDANNAIGRKTLVVN